MTARVASGLQFLYVFPRDAPKKLDFPTLGHVAEW